MVLDDELQIMYEDACVNYDTGRYEDAFRGFKHLIERISGDYPSKLYMIYRGLVVANLDNMKLKYHRLILKLIRISLEHTITDLLKLVENEVNLAQKVEYMDLLQLSLFHLGEMKKREKVNKTLIDNLIRLSSGHDISLNQKIDYQEKALNIVQDDEKEKKIKNRLGENYEQKAEQLYKRNKSKYEIIDTLKKAKQMFDNLNLVEKVDSLNEKISNYEIDE